VYGDVSEACRRHAGGVLDNALAPMGEEYPDVPVHRKVVAGSARQALLVAARDADLLVVGARRRQGQVGLQLGLVNHGVLHHAPCPVVVVPQM
jgi:nucleotide-binding universal stress UspA family protein